MITERLWKTAPSDNAALGQLRPTAAGIVESRRSSRNAFPSWIHRIPEMIETLALAGAERIAYGQNIHAARL
jgi:hypothetical protein